MSIACALRWGVASVGITLLGVTHPIWEKHFRCEIYVGGRFSFKISRVKKPTCGFYNYFFVNFLEQTSFNMYFYVKEL